MDYEEALDTIENKRRVTSALPLLQAVCVVLLHIVDEQEHILGESPYAQLKQFQADLEWLTVWEICRRYMDEAHFDVEKRGRPLGHMLDAMEDELRKALGLPPVE